MGTTHVNPAGANALLVAFREVRAATEALAAPLSAEDQQIQSMPDASPTKWHLAHTTWFFETFVLAPRAPGYHTFHPRFGYLFNSYYETLGQRHDRSRRGLLSRPSLDDVLAYRRHVDGAIGAFVREGQLDGPLLETVELGIHHEQQHQELILTDIKHALGMNPLQPPYRETPPPPPDDAPPLASHRFDGGLVAIGHADGGFAFDNEGPSHQVFLQPYALASRPVTAGEYLGFIRDRGYQRPELWLSDGWRTLHAEAWQAPLYWEERDGVWWLYTLAGTRRVDPSEPVCHVSYYEADAYARWAGARLPTEFELEHATTGVPMEGNFVEDGRRHPGSAPAGTAPVQLYGDVWEWTRSAYAPYPGFRPASGAVGEYNGKFMCNQMVLRGGSCLTPRSHMRLTYRNFFPPEARWQMTGIRLARDDD